jgi:excisionase family DNA binding protein
MTSTVPDIPISEAAKLLGVCWKTANKWVHSGKLQSVKVGGRYRTTMEWIEAVAEPVSVPGPSPSKAERQRAKEVEACLQRIEARFGIRVPGRPPKRRD